MALSLGVSVEGKLARRPDVGVVDDRLDILAAIVVVDFVSSVREAEVDALAIILAAILGIFNRPGHCEGCA